MNMEIKKKSKEIGEIAEKYGLDLVVLFGSQATGRTHSRSDVDIGYTAPQLLDLDTRFKIETDISRLLGRADVEFVDLQRVPPTMKKIIADEGVVLYERRPETFTAFCAYAFKLYVENAPLRESRYQSLRNFIYGTA